MKKIYTQKIKQFISLLLFIPLALNNINAQYLGGSGDGHGSGIHAVQDFSTLPPTAPKALAASDITSTTFTANWSSNLSATNYYLDVDDNNDFSSPLASYDNLDVGNVSTYAVTGLSGGTQYYYRLRAYNANGTSINSNTINASIKEITITGITIDNKTYDGNTSATINGTPLPSGVYSGDDVSIVSTGATATFINSSAGAGKAITVSGYTLSGANAGDYTLVQPAGLTADIGPANLTVSGIGVSNKSYDGNTSATITGTPALNGIIGTDLVTIVSSGATAAFDNSTIGTTKPVTISGYTLAGIHAGNYSIIQPTSLTADITIKDLTITEINIENKVYDGTTNAVITGALNLSGAVPSEEVTLVSTGASANFDTKDIGTTKAITVTGFTLTGANAGNYNLQQPTGLTADITAKSLTITDINIENKVYDGTTNAVIGGTLTLSGKVDTEDVTLVTTGASASFDNKNIGTGKAVTVIGFTIEGAAIANYSLTQPAGLTAAITAKNLTIDGISINNKVYDGTTNAVIGGSLALNGIIDTEDVTFVTTSAGASFDTKDIGTGKAITISGYTLDGTAVGNYSLTQPTGFTADITAKELTINGITIDHKVYDGNANAVINGTAILLGKINSEDVTVVTTGASATFDTKNIGTGKPVTVIGYTLDGTAAGNYSLTQPAGFIANIQAKNLTISGISINHKVYDGTTDAVIFGSAALNGIVDGESVTAVVTNANASFDNKNTGIGKVITVAGYTLSGPNAVNYSLTQPIGLIANITAKNLSLSGITVENKTYDGTTIATISGTPSLTGIVDPDVVTVDGSGISANFDTKNIGTTKPVTISGYALSGAGAGNYTVTQPTGLSADITVKSVSINNISVGNKIYDGNTGATITGTPLLEGVVGSDVVTVNSSGASANFDNKNIGTGKPITISGYAIGGSGAGNYSLNQPTGMTANITAKSLTISGLTVNNKTYDGNSDAVISGTATLSGIVGSEIVTVNGTGASASFNNQDVGAGKPIMITGYSLDGSGAGNYTLIQPLGLTANITPKDLTISGISIENKLFDGNTDATIIGTPALNGVVVSDDVSLVSSGATALFNNNSIGTGKPVTVSGYTISGTDAGNYNLIQPTGLTASITSKSLTISGLIISNKVYDGTTNATITGVPVLNGVEGSDVVTLNSTNATANFDSKTIGNGKSVIVTGYILSGVDADNYALTQPTGLTAGITPKSLTISGINIEDKPFDGNAAATITGTPVLMGVVALDNVTLIGTGATAIFANSTIGAGKTVTVSGYAITGTDAANYNLLQPTGLTAAITAKDLTISGLTINNKIYDGNTTATLTGVPVLNGVEGSDVVTLDGTNASASFTTKIVGNAKIVMVTGYNISGANAGNYSLTQPTGLTANISAKDLTISGITANNKEYDGTDVATLSGGVLEGVVVGDVVLLNAGTGVFADVNVGSGISVSISGYTVTGTDAQNYNLIQPTGLTADITKATPIITWENPADIVRGTALGATQLNATANVSGTFVYNPAAGTILNTGNNQDLNVDFTPTDDGNYNNANKTVQINVTPATGIIELSGSQVSVFPNPANELITLSGLSTFKNSKDIQLIIQDLNGKIILSKKIGNTTGKEIINVSGFEYGVYIINLQTDTERIIKRIIKI